MTMQIGTLAEWIAGVGSLATAIASVWLAWNPQRIKVDAQCKAMLAFSYDGKTKCFMVSATNVGYRSVTITSIGFYYKRRLLSMRRRMSAVLMPPTTNARESSPMPATLADGQRATWFYPQEVIVNELITKLVKTEKDAKTLQCILGTTHGKVIIVLPDDGVVKILIEALSEKSGKPSIPQK